MNQSIRRLFALLPLLVSAFLSAQGPAPSTSYQISTWKQIRPAPTGSPYQGGIVAVGQTLFCLRANGEVRSSVFGFDGSLSAWSECPPMPHPELNVRATAVVGQYFIIASSPTSMIATVSDAGMITQWTEGPGLVDPYPINNVASAVDGNRVYFLGGAYSSNADIFDVRMTELQPDGTLKDWQRLVPLPFGAGAAGGRAVVFNGSLYYFGGYNDGWNLGNSRSVWRAPINSDGTIRSWDNAGNLRDPRPFSSILSSNGTLHVIGGGLNGYMTNSVESVLLNQLGNPDEAIYSAPLGTVLNDSCGVVIGRFGLVFLGNTQAFGGGEPDYGLLAELAPPAPPVIADLSADQTQLWPPNHKMVLVTLSYALSDIYEPASAITAVLTASSSEPPLKPGSGNTNPDIQVVDPNHLYLRAERSGNGPGRTYTVTVTATNSSGLSASANIQVFVPHN